MVSIVSAVMSMYMYTAAKTVVIGMWWSSHSHSTTCELQTFSAHSTFNECFTELCVKCELIGKSLF